MAERLFPDFATDTIADVGNGDPNKQPISSALKTEGWGVVKPDLQDMNQQLNTIGRFIRGNNEFKTEADGYEAEAGEMILMDNSAGIVTGNLPANPVDGQWVVFGGVGKFSAFAVNIEGGANDIMVAADTTCILDGDDTLYLFYWDASASIWVINITGLQGRIL